jgi:hypothetical protein
MAPTDGVPQLKLLTHCWLLTSALLLTGCGTSKPDPVHVRGTISFRGKPVPNGMVVIHPDTAKGNEGQRGYAAIKNGTFDTSIDNGQAAAQGSVKFVVGGTEDAANKEADESKALFPPYQFDAEVEPTKATFDIKVPG